ncbi:hypothetical protein HUR95_14970 [Caldalkalibacillus thermarum TA2.A1]|uniref:Uncharacterized protein n=1 Tax=Caldalkalibacillus thermarum (strain TA2.A1) TaxID=986075 RepID=A0A8X8LC07_CALTT|nr:hypothetical protein HUR95_14970 [Caldalkalibacillus thermarum TA2.A1]
MQFKQRCKYWGYKSKEIAAQIFLPLAIFQLVRTIIFPTAFDVLLLLVIFVIILFLLIDWM